MKLADIKVGRDYEIKEKRMRARSACVLKVGVDILVIVPFGGLDVRDGGVCVRFDDEPRLPQVVEAKHVRRLWSEYEQEQDEQEPALVAQKKQDRKDSARRVRLLRELLAITEVKLGRRQGIKPTNVNLTLDELDAIVARLEGQRAAAEGVLTEFRAIKKMLPWIDDVDVIEITYRRCDQWDVLQAMGRAVGHATKLEQETKQ
jgi:hypothetical protein